MDYVVIGAGSAGSVITRRLIDAGYRVCLLEAGGDDNSILVQAPMGYAVTLPTKINNWAYETVPQVGLKGRRGYQPRGKVLGGSSSINAMIYVRGHPADYDDWAAFGNAGWSWQEVLPYFKRAENNQNFTDDLHGTKGPLHVESPQNASPFNDYFFEAAALNQHTLNPDFNGETQEGGACIKPPLRTGNGSAPQRVIYTIF